MYRQLSLCNWALSWLLLAGLEGTSRPSESETTRPAAAVAQHPQSEPNASSGAPHRTTANSKPLVKVHSNKAQGLIYFACDEEPWEKVLTRLARELGLTLQMDSAPPGRFTYRSPTGYTAEGALELVHGVLLDRGITLIRHDALLQVVRLADELHWILVPHVRVEDLATTPGTMIVQTSIPLRNLVPSVAAAELEPMLSSRGRLAGVDHARRLIACDQVRLLRTLVQLLAQLDPEENPPAARLRVFPLRYIPAADVLFVAEELLGASNPPPRSAAPPIDFAKMGQQLGTNQMIEAFIPGFSLPGLVPDIPREKLPPRLVIDRRRNAVLVSGEPEVLALVAQVVGVLDVAPQEEPTVPPRTAPHSPTPPPSAQDEPRPQSIRDEPPPRIVAWIELPPDRNVAEAKRLLDHLFQVIGGSRGPAVLAEGERYIIVRGTADELSAAHRLVGARGEFRPLGESAPRQTYPNRP